jgi:hypothetical protein
MKKQRKSGKVPTELRRQAEERLGAKKREDESNAPSTGDPQRLLHELEVYQIELEMQNEGLQAAQHELEIGLARYRELFDFAPVGYATLGPEQTIIGDQPRGRAFARG